MIKKKKKLFSIIIVIVSAFIFVSGCLSVYFSYFYRYKGNDIVYNWSKDDSFNIDTIVTINKDEDKDFTILNLTDIQLADIEDFFHRETIRKEIDYLVKKVNPDLITLTGDQTWSNENLMSLKCIIRWLDSYKIPYAPILGNHDCGNEYNSAVASINYCSDLYEKSKYCLYKRGPSNIGYIGNYVINIMEGDKIFKSLYMINTGIGDEVTDEQIEWVKWNADGIKQLNNGEYVQGMCFMHKPIDQFSEAYYSYARGDSQSLVKVLVNCSLYGASDNGFYSVAKSCGIKYYIAGHQHTNSFSINYDNCNFTFALKTGELSFYYDDGETNYNGGTVLVLGENDRVYNEYVKSGQFHINGSTNTYYGFE